MLTDEADRKALREQIASGAYDADELAYIRKAEPWLDDELSEPGTTCTCGNGPENDGPYEGCPVHGQPDGVELVERLRRLGEHHEGGIFNEAANALSAAYENNDGTAGLRRRLLEGVPASEVIQIDLIDRAGTRYEFGWVYPADLWPMIEDEVMAAAKVEADRMHGAVQAYYPDDPEKELPC